MKEKLLGLLELFLEKCLYESIISIFLTLVTILLLTDKNWVYDKLSWVEVRLLFFVTYFIIIIVIKIIYKFIRTKWSAHIDMERNRKENKERAKIKEEENIKKYQEDRNVVKKIIVNFPVCDKKILLKFLENQNSPIEIENRTYDGKLLYTNLIEITKKYEKPIEINFDRDIEGIEFIDNLNEYYTQFKMLKPYFEVIKNIYNNDGKSYFEWN